MPALNATQCAEVVWTFAAASPNSPTFNGYSGYNVRCGTGSPKCAVSGAACATDANCDPTGTGGDVCVPACAALGAIFRSSPTTAGPPSSLNRDEGYRVFADKRSTRTPALFVATTDGVLHGFKALDPTSADGGAAPGTKHELWAFVPPAVLPKLAANYPAGQQILLDGSPIVKDVVWDRDRGAVGLSKHWHTTLVAGMGTNGPGYYALNVSDVACDTGAATGNCEADYEKPTAYDPVHVSAAAHACPVDDARRGVRGDVDG